ncbi:MAG: hypothetical protein EOS36_00640 [Mesorhizobium sp.]|uniref:hypothetical protein n=1 Tax=Mesorhizobium sp. TaxID=1871066 RepID=UPI000FE49FBD|nr:hypothetical protein [Mesorhizobium sp.]RWD68081.1 MAG: hypothetical protein EOS36_00640 [Mesorhizobium sp.]RWE51138.1 MAG: hypothetical protein EOS79_01455 [Mesorhizobium sp.]
MSDDYHRPTYTTKDVHGAFNATQVRLYGIPGLPKLKKENDGLADVLTIVIEDLLLIATSVGSAPIDGDAGNYIKELFSSQSATPNSSYVFVQSILKKYMLMLGCIEIHPKEDADTIMSSGIIFGYAYEGHTYDFPKPKIMMIPANPETEIPYDDSDYKLKEKEGYAVWIVDKLDQCVEFEMNQGFVEQVVLEANLPGKRSPTMYAARQALGHRSGRLTE